MVTKKEYEDALNTVTSLLKARNRALNIIDDGKARYVKEKTRARSKKAAAERDALLNAAKFSCLNMYDRKNDISEAYGCGCISETDMDRLEALWDEREYIKENLDDNGLFQDNVTEALKTAYIHISDIWEKEIEDARQIIKEYEASKCNLEKIDENYKKL